MRHIFNIIIIRKYINLVMCIYNNIYNYILIGYGKTSNLHKYIQHIVQSYKLTIKIINQCYTSLFANSYEIRSCLFMRNNKMSCKNPVNLFLKLILRSSKMHAYLIEILDIIKSYIKMSSKYFFSFLCKDSKIKITFKVSETFFV